MRHSILMLLTTLLALAAPYRLIDLAEAKTHYNAHDALFVDARDANMVAKGTIFGAFNVPLKRFKRMKKWLPARTDAPLVIFCNGAGCGKSLKLAKKFARAGYTQLMVYQEGFPEWSAHKLPILTTPKPCRCDERAYTPTTQPVQVAGATLYLSDDPTHVDSRWVVSLIHADKFPDGIQLIDVRPATQYKDGHLKGAINVPFDSDKHTIDAAKFPADKAILLYCNHGAISADAFDALPKMIVGRVKVFEADVACKAEECRVEAR
jgi:rhodanese-related sulfurtransferase